MYDLVVAAARRPEPGETLVGASFETYLGGKGFNQAVAAARAGARTSFVGRLGDDDFGREFLDSLREEGIDASRVVQDSQLGTGVGLPVVEPNGENSIIIVPRANLALTPEDVESSRALIETAAVVLLQLEVPIDASLRAARIAHDAGVAVVLNPAPFADVPTDFREVVDVVVPNEVELRALACDDGVGTDVSELATAAHARWPTTLVVTLGPEGVLVLDGSPAEISVVSAHRVEAVDTVGAGDVFCGYLGARLAAGAALVDAVAAANAAAALAVTRPGGGLSAPRAAEVRGLVAASASTERPAPLTGPVGSDLL